MIMISMTTQRKEPIAGLFSLEDVSLYNISLRVPLFIKPYDRIALVVVNLCSHEGFIKKDKHSKAAGLGGGSRWSVNRVLYNADPSINDVKYLDTQDHKL